MISEQSLIIEPEAHLAKSSSISHLSHVLGIWNQTDMITVAGHQCHSHHRHFPVNPPPIAAEPDGFTRPPLAKSMIRSRRQACAPPHPAVEPQTELTPANRPTVDALSLCRLTVQFAEHRSPTHHAAATRSMKAGTVPWQLLCFALSSCILHTHIVVINGDLTPLPC